MGMIVAPDGSVHLVPEGWRLAQLPDGQFLPLPENHSVADYLKDCRTALQRAYHSLESLERTWERGGLTRAQREMASQRIKELRATIQGLRETLQLPPDASLKPVEETIGRAVNIGQKTFVENPGARAAQQTTRDLRVEPSRWARFSEAVRNALRTLRSVGSRGLEIAGRAWNATRAGVSRAWNAVSSAFSMFLLMHRTFGFRGALGAAIQILVRGFPGGLVGILVSILVSLLAAAGLYSWAKGGGHGPAAEGGLPGPQAVCDELVDLGGEPSWGGTVVEHLEGTRGSYCSVELPASGAQAGGLLAVIEPGEGAAPGLACRLAALGFSPPPAGVTMWAPFYREPAHDMSRPLQLSQPGFGQTQWYEVQRSLSGMGQVGWEIPEGTYPGASPEEIMHLNYMVMFCRGPYLIFGGTVINLFAGDPDLPALTAGASAVRRMAERVDGWLVRQGFGGGDPSRER